MTAISPMPTVSFRYELRIKGAAHFYEGTASAPDCEGALEQLCRDIAKRIAKREGVAAEQILSNGHFVFRRLP